MYEALILLLSVALGSLLGYWLSGKKSITKFLLTFSGAYFLGIAVLEIFPEVYEKHDPTIGLFVLAGLFFQIIIESLSKGAEHGHVHVRNKQEFPLSIFLGLLIHSFFEGMPIGSQSTHHLLWAVFIHNIPISMILFAALSQMNISQGKKIALMLAFAFAGPLGILFGKTALASYQQESIAFVAGIFIHIATVILFESSENHKFKTQKVLTILLGFVIAFLTVSFGHHHG